MEEGGPPILGGCRLEEEVEDGEDVVFVFLEGGGVIKGVLLGPPLDICEMLLFLSLAEERRRTCDSWEDAVRALGLEKREERLLSRCCCRCCWCVGEEGIRRGGVKAVEIEEEVVEVVEGLLWRLEVREGVGAGVERAGEGRRRRPPGRICPCPCNCALGGARGLTGVVFILALPRCCVDQLAVLAGEELDWFWLWLAMRVLWSVLGPLVR